MNDSEKIIDLFHAGLSIITMKMNTKLKFFAAIIIIVAIAGVIVLLNHSEQSHVLTNADKANEEYDQANEINLTEHFEKYAKGYAHTNITPIVKPNFKVGDFFEYELYGRSSVISSDPKVSGGYATQSGRETFKVTGIEKRNITECYVVSTTFNTASETEIIKAGKKEIDVFGQEVVQDHYISKDTGEILKSVTSTYKMFRNGRVTQFPSQELMVPENMRYIQGVGDMFYPWMLALTDDFKAEITDNQHTFTAKTELEVVGTERIKNRNCFKVEKREILTEEGNAINIVNEIVYLWVDKDKRILVRSETYIDNVKVSTMELV